MFSINSRSIVQIKLRGTPHCTRNRSSIVYFRHHLKPSSKLPKVLNIIAGVVLNRKTFVRPAAAATSEWCTFGKKRLNFLERNFFEKCSGNFSETLSSITSNNVLYCLAEKSVTKNIPPLSTKSNNILLM